MAFLQTPLAIIKGWLAPKPQPATYFTEEELYTAAHVACDYMRARNKKFIPKFVERQIARNLITEFAGRKADRAAIDRMAGRCERMVDQLMMPVHRGELE